MAKPLNERIASARSTDRVTITDLEALIADVTAERDRFAGIVTQATADSIRFELSEEDRDEAAKTAERAKRNSLAMSAALDELSAKLTAKRASEQQNAEKAAREAAIAERDMLVDRLRTEWPVIEGQVIELLSAVQANEEKLKGLRIYEGNAEAIARGCAGNFMDGSVPVRRLTETKLPSFTGRDFAWPKPSTFNPSLHMEQHQKNLLAMRDEEARWKRYIVTPPHGNRDVIPLLIKNGPNSVRDTPIIGRMTDEGVAAARKTGCTVEPAAANVSIGMPAGAAFLS
ncbi:hypothetical protein [Novosphingobium sp.]|uniref:hypothetical protein n=1 Tax=Novosphingobium sp. TaxID=1874826 RepID=UPI002C84AD9C|nr:hypothetical protein [Sphingobium sp.]